MGYSKQTSVTQVKKMDFDFVTEELLDIPQLVWDNGTLMGRTSLEEVRFPEEKGFVHRERFGRIYFYLVPQTSPDSTVQALISYRATPHVTYGDVQRLQAYLASVISGMYLDHLCENDDASDTESVGTLDLESVVDVLNEEDTNNTYDAEENDDDDADSLTGSDYD